MMDRIPSIALTGLSLSHHPLSQNLSNSSNSASLNQQALNSLNFHQQSNHSHHQLNQNLNHSLISSSNNVSQHNHHHHSQQQQIQQQQQMHSTNLHHHQQLNGLLNNVGANGWVSIANDVNSRFHFWSNFSLIVPQFLVSWHRHHWWKSLKMITLNVQWTLLW